MSQGSFSPPKLWLAGLPCAEDRHLSRNEITALKARPQELNAFGCLAGCASPVALFALIAVTTSFSDALSNDFWTVPIVFLVIGAPVALIVKAATCWEQAKELESITHHARTLIFQGDKSEVLEDCRADVTRNLESSTRLVTIEALPSGEVLKINEKVPLLALRIEVTKMPPAFADSFETTSENDKEKISARRFAKRKEVAIASSKRDGIGAVLLCFTVVGFFVVLIVVLFATFKKRKHTKQVLQSSTRS